jgi:hypothetical protein
MRLAHLGLFGLPVAVIASLMTVGDSSGTPPADEAARLRCVNRLAFAFTGRPPDATLSSSADPQTQVDALMADPAFVEQFARFVNSKLNPEPADTATPQQDATYYLAKYVLANNRPWHELFDGQYTIQPVAATATEPATAQVVADANGLGYFRSRPWMVRYAGNEETGLRLAAAYRIQQNITGLDVAAVTNAPTVDTSATGRMASGCAGCHYNEWFALDKVASILSKVDVTNTTNITFIPQPAASATVLDGQEIHNDKELVQALLGSTDAKFRTCRLAFEYLYGRPEANCEAPLFDSCIDAYTQTGDVKAALRAIAQDPGYCE